jgi:tetratricopeptide (TPR) repeat protein
MKNLKILILFIFIQSFLGIINVKAKEKSLEEIFTISNKFYLSKDYDKAIKGYEFIIKGGKTSPELFYNLGNCYYKTNDLGKAILYYEKSLKIDPNNEDALFNLKLAQLKTVDKITKPDSIAFIEWLKGIFYPSNPSKPLQFLIIFLFIGLISLAIVLFTNKLNFKRFGFSILTLSVILIITNGILVYVGQKNAEKQYAVITQGISYIKTAPQEDAPDAFFLHSGTKVKVLEPSQNGFIKIELQDGKQGFLKTEDSDQI